MGHPLISLISSMNDIINIEISLNAMTLFGHAQNGRSSC